MDSVEKESSGIREKKRLRKGQTFMAITKVEIIPLDILFRLQRRLSRGPVVQGDRGVLKGKPVLVRIHSEEGAVGNGEARPHQPFQGETTQSVVSAIRDFYAPVLLGEDPFNMERIVSKFDGVLPGNPYARAAIDFALYDLMGKLLNVPVYKLLGGLYWEEIPLEWSVGLNPAELMLNEVTTCIEKYGVKVFCLKVGPSERWKEDVETFKAIRKAVGDDIAIGIDANAAYSPSVAIKAIRQMEEFNLNYAEQPVPASDLEGMIKVRGAVNTPILADESVYTVQDAFQILRTGAADVLCVKTSKPGGLFNSKKIAAVADGCNSLVNVAGTAQGVRIEAAANAHFYASTRNIFPAGEFVMGITEEDPIASQPFTIKNGCVTVPKSPGLGVEIDEKALAKYSLAKYGVE
jgi:muconate cycloisomerase